MDKEAPGEDAEYPAAITTLPAVPLELSPDKIDTVPELIIDAPVETLISPDSDDGLDMTATFPLEPVSLAPLVSSKPPPEFVKPIPADIATEPPSPPDPAAILTSPAGCPTADLPARRPMFPLEPSLESPVIRLMSPDPAVAVAEEMSTDPEILPDPPVILTEPPAPDGAEPPDNEMKPPARLLVVDSPPVISTEDPPDMDSFPPVDMPLVAIIATEPPASDVPSPLEILTSPPNDPVPAAMETSPPFAATSDEVPAVMETIAPIPEAL